MASILISAFYRARWCYGAADMLLRLLMYNTYKMRADPDASYMQKFSWADGLHRSLIGSFGFEIREWSAFLSFSKLRRRGLNFERSGFDENWVEGFWFFELSRGLGLFTKRF